MSAGLIDGTEGIYDSSLEEAKTLADAIKDRKYLNGLSVEHGLGLIEAYAMIAEACKRNNPKG